MMRLNALAFAFNVTWCNLFHLWCYWMYFLPLMIWLTIIYFVDAMSEWTFCAHDMPECTEYRMICLVLSFAYIVTNFTFSTLWCEWMYFSPITWVNALSFANKVTECTFFHIWFDRMHFQSPIAYLNALCFAYDVAGCTFFVYDVTDCNLFAYDMTECTFCAHDVPECIFFCLWGDWMHFLSHMIWQNALSDAMTWLNAISAATSQLRPPMAFLSHNSSDTPGLAPLMNVSFWGRCDFPISFSGRDM